MTVPVNCMRLTRFFYAVVERPDAILERQLKQADEVLDVLVTRPLLSFQREALVCLLSDVMAGLAASPSETPFSDSFLLKALNRGMFQVAAAEFHSFCYQKGKLSQKAWHKRRAEQLLFARGRLLF